jgi:hypothetical protein
MYKLLRIQSTMHAGLYHREIGQQTLSTDCKPEWSVYWTTLIL